MKTRIALSFRSFKPRALMLASLIILLSACRPATKGGLPICSADALQNPNALRPGDQRDELGILVDSLTPTFSWTYPDPACSPEYFTLRMDKDLTEFALRADYEIRIDGASRSWVPPSPLDSGQMYYWTLRAEVGEEKSDDGIAIFRTGPECVVISPGTMLAPILLFPFDGQILPDRHFALEWEDPTECIPPGDYKVQFDTSPAFTHPLEVNSLLSLMSMVPGVAGFELEDCTRYYWRVKIDLRDRVDSEDGPWSAIWSFTINESGICAGIPSTRITPIPGFDLPPGITDESSWITGIVWHDLCALPYASTDVAPPGCVWVDSIHGYEANGVYDTGEPGIAGVQVDLGAGACPSTGLATTTTASDGRYAFGPLAAGTYCVSIDATADPNIPILLPGGWTFPVRDAPIAQYQITLLDADIRRGNDFGWDYQFLPAPASATPTATLKQNAYCLRGPGEGYDSLTILTQGSQVPIEGRNQDGTWWWVRVPNSQIHCWVGGSMVQTSGNVNALPLVEAPPLACWVYQKDQSKKCVSPCPEGAQPGGECKP